MLVRQLIRFWASKLNNDVLLEVHHTLNRHMSRQPHAMLPTCAAQLAATQTITNYHTCYLLPRRLPLRRTLVLQRPLPYPLPCPAFQRVNLGISGLVREDKAFLQDLIKTLGELMASCCVCCPGVPALCTALGAVHWDGCIIQCPGEGVAFSNHESMRLCCMSASPCVCSAHHTDVTPAGGLTAACRWHSRSTT
jgi:hypothetical protein